MKIYTHKTCGHDEGARLEADVFEVDGGYHVGYFKQTIGHYELMTRTYPTLSELLEDVERLGYYVDVKSAGIQEPL